MHVAAEVFDRSEEALPEGLGGAQVGARIVERPQGLGIHDARQLGDGADDVGGNLPAGGH